MRGLVDFRLLKLRNVGICETLACCVPRIKPKRGIDMCSSQYSILVGFSAGIDCLVNPFIFARNRRGDYESPAKFGILSAA